MRLLLICTFNIFCFLNSYAQEKKDSVVEKSFSAGLYTDYGKLATYWTDFESKLEFGAVAKIKNWAVGVEYGMADLNPLRPYQNGDVSISGSYMGGYFQYYLPIDNRNGLFVGVGYYKSTFNEDITFTIESDLWGIYEEKIHREDIKASWLALRLGSEQRLNSFLFLGGVFEYRIKTSMDEFEDPIPLSIPGYGRGKSSSTPAVNLYLLVRF